MFFQFVPDPPVSHIRMAFMDGPDLLCDLLVAFLAEAYRIPEPSVVSPSRKVKMLTQSLHRIMLFF